MSPYESAALDDPDLGAMLARMFPRLLALETPILETAGLSMWEYAILTELHAYASVSQAELSSRTGRDPTRLGKHLADLEGRSLVTRERSQDQRAHLVALSPDGRRLFTSVKRKIRAAETEFLHARLGADEGDQLRGLLRRLAEEADA